MGGSRDVAGRNRLLAVWALRILEMLHHPGSGVRGEFDYCRREMENAGRMPALPKTVETEVANYNPYALLRRMEPSPVWMTMGWPPPFILPWSWELLKVPSTVRGMPMVMWPSLVLASMFA